ncbi:MAG: SLBB domain-containing protein [Acidobacteriota bacterium]
MVFLFPAKLIAQSSQNGALGSTGLGNSGGALDCGNGMSIDSPGCALLGQQSTSPLMDQTGMPGSVMPGVGIPGQSNLPTNRQNYFSDTEPFTQQPRLARPLPLPPAPLTEFQKFVASTTGEILPVFGASLFRTVPSTFAPENAGPVPDDYVIGPGDELRIHVWGQFNFTATVRVDRSGNVYVPQIGAEHVGGLHFSELEPHLRSAFSRIYHNFELSVDLGQIRTIQVYVTGQAQRPGLYTISSLSTLIDALFASGGPSPQGSLRHIEVRRGGKVVVDFDLYDLLLHGDRSEDTNLEPGDVIFIPPIGPEAAVVGSVRVPAIYELRDQETLGQLVAAAGGASAVAAETRIYIERIDNHRDRQVVEADFDSQGLSTPVRDGDLVRVNPITPTYEKTVMLRGNTANPGRYAWHPGMRLSELIPSQEALITRNFWWKRAQLGLPAPEFERSGSFSTMVQPGDHPVPFKFTDALPGTLPAETVNGMNQGQQGSLATAAGQQAALQQTQTPQTQQTPPAQPQASTETLAEARSEPQRPGMPQKTQVQLLSPEIDWDYAVIDRQDPTTLKTRLIPFDLGRLVLQHDASQDLELQPGDVITIFSQGDIQVPLAQQTKFVKLEGEFVHSGVYSVKPGETLRELVERAGGFTPNAYLYGSQFTRLSTRAMQQARLDEYVQTLQLQIQRNTLALAGSSVSQSQGLATGTAAQGTEEQLIGQLRQMRATGRIVLQLRPNSAGVNALPDLQLENGDALIVPPVPESVNVIGAVYDQNSFLYAQTQRLEGYLNLAGGPNANADTKREFVIRADGEVVSRDSVNSPWGNHFNSLHLNPGDTLVIPEKNITASALRGFLAWSQLFSQLAFGAAAISILQ